MKDKYLEKRYLFERILRELYRMDNGSSGKILCSSEGLEILEFSRLNDTSVEARKGKSRITVKSIDSRVLQKAGLRYYIPLIVSESTYNNGRLQVNEQTGIFKVKLPGRLFLYCARWNSEGLRNTMEELFVTSQKTWEKLKRIEQIEKEQKRIPPSNGIFRLIEDRSDNLIYIPKDFPSEKLVLSPEVDLCKDIDYFFDDISSFLKYGQPGLRASMIVGPPGTGKTSYCYELGRKYQDKYLVVYTTSFWELFQHILLCANYGRSTIAFLEDADSVLQGAESRMLNILQGIDTPVNKMGTYIIMTTNYPEKIDRRFTRKGRIDKKIKLDVLEKELAMECARYYFSERDISFDDFNRKEEYPKLMKIFDQLTGAQIKALACSTSEYLVNRGISKISFEILNNMKNELIEEERILRDLNQKHASVAERKIGFDYNEKFF